MTARLATAFLIFVLSVLTLSAAKAANDKRVALVIGNSAYQHTAPLANPGTDAADMSAMLKRLGFVVVEGRDLDKQSMDRIVRTFARELANADVGFFFYAGHGLQVDGQNFLVPVDAKLDDPSGLEFETLRLDSVHRTMERATRTNLIFLDACRDNPLARNLARSLGTRSATIGRGLASVESGEGTLISFSTAPGTVALDGNGRNSPYATALLKQLDSSSDDVSSILIEVRNEVMRETKRRQVPWEHSALTAKFYFKTADATTPSAPGTPPPSPAQSGSTDAGASATTFGQQAELAYWATIKESKDPRVFESYLVAFPRGIFSPLARVLVEQLKTEQTLKDAEQNRVEAERLKQSDEIRRLQEAVRKERETLAVLERDKRAALKQAEAAEAAAKMQAFSRPPPVVPMPAPPPPPTPPTFASQQPAITGEALVRGIQTELNRVGCNAGAVDGKWTTTGRSALADFARRTSVRVSVEEPTMEALESIKAQRARICPLVCDDDEEEKNGECVAKPSAKKSQSAKKPECDDDEVLKNGRCVPAPKKSSGSSRSDSSSSRQTTQRSAGPAKSGGSDGMCWDHSGRYVKCRDIGGAGYNGNQR